MAKPKSSSRQQASTQSQPDNTILMEVPALTEDEKDIARGPSRALVAVVATIRTQCKKQIKTSAAFAEFAAALENYARRFNAAAKPAKTRAAG